MHLYFKKRNYVNQSPCVSSSQIILFNSIILIYFSLRSPCTYWQNSFQRFLEKLGKGAENMNGWVKYETLHPLCLCVTLNIDIMVCSYLADFYSIWDATRISIFIMRRIAVKSVSLARHSDDNGNNNDNDNSGEASLYYLLCTRASHILFHCVFTEASGKVVILCIVIVLVTGWSWNLKLWTLKLA